MYVTLPLIGSLVHWFTGTLLSHIMSTSHWQMFKIWEHKKIKIKGRSYFSAHVIRHDVASMVGGTTTLPLHVAIF